MNQILDQKGGQNGTDRVLEMLRNGVPKGDQKETRNGAKMYAKLSKNDCQIELFRYKIPSKMYSPKKQSKIELGAKAQV